MSLPNEWSRTVHSLIAGSTAGSLGVVVGQPIDMLRVRLQIGAQNFTHSTGFLALFKGVVPPLLMTGVVSSLQFGVYQGIQNECERRLSKSSRALPLWTHFVAGFGAGAALSIVTSPFLILKVQQQALGEDLLHSAARLVRAEGARGLFRGFGAHFYADSAGRGVYMMSYEALKRVAGSDCSSLSNAQRLVAGAGAGMLTWLAIYPADVVRSRLFALRPGLGSLSSSQCVRLVYREHGWKGFFKGMGLTVLSAGPIAAVVLPTYDLILQLLAG